MNYSKSRFRTVIQLIYSTFRESLSILKRKGLIMSFDWFLFRIGLSTGLLRNHRQKEVQNTSVPDDLHIRGYSFLDKVSQEQVSKLIKYFLEENSFKSIDEYRDYYQLKKILRPNGLLAKGTKSCIISQFSNSSYILNIVHEYLGIPKNNIQFYGIIDALIYLENGRNFQKPEKITYGDDDKIEFHRDVDARKFVKIFVYLNDVKDGSGHHEFFEKTHISTPLYFSHAKRYDSSDIKHNFFNKKMLPPELVKITGSAGTCFIENTFGFHRGTLPIVKGEGRLMLTLIYYDKKSASHYNNFYSLF